MDRERHSRCDSYTPSHPYADAYIHGDPNGHYNPYRDLYPHSHLHGDSDAHTHGHLRAGQSSDCYAGAPQHAIPNADAPAERTAFHKNAPTCDGNSFASRTNRHTHGESRVGPDHRNCHTASGGDCGPRLWRNNDSDAARCYPSPHEQTRAGVQPYTIAHESADRFEFQSDRTPNVTGRYVKSNTGAYTYASRTSNT